MNKQQEEILPFECLTLKLECKQHRFIGRAEKKKHSPSALFKKHKSNKNVKACLYMH